MDRAKIQIEVNNYREGTSLLCCAVSLRGGYATRDYLLDDKTHFVSSYAFYNVLFHYFRLTEEIGDMHFDVQRAASTISFCRRRNDLVPGLNQVLRVLFRREYDREKFETAKKNAAEGFALRYRSGDFRAKYKGLEFTDLNKRFSLPQLIRDIESISYEQFTRSAGALLVPGNLCVYICGRTDELDLSALAAGEFSDLPGHTVRLAGFGFDPYLRQDAHIVNVAREDHNLILEAFDFLNPQATNFAKQLILDLHAQQLPGRDTEVWVDSFDASILFSTEYLRSYKGLLSIPDEKTFEAARKRLLSQYAALQENRTEHFTVKAANLMTVGIYMDQYMNYLAGCGFDEFREICQKADFKITEAQIALRKESR